MRLGPGKHLKGLTLMGGIVTPEQVSILAYFLRNLMLNIVLV
jgi:hypothetical protein